MMTKDQIESKTFKKGLFGYNKDEVNSFLRTMAEEYGDLQHLSQRTRFQKRALWRTV